MISLPKIKRDPKKTTNLCKCHPVCKNRRPEWKGQLQNTSAELLKPIHDCFRKWPTRVYPNSPCPLFSRIHPVTVIERGCERPPNVVRICQAPVDDAVETPYLKFAQIVKNLGAMDAVKSHCSFCKCRGCCVCRQSDYQMADETRDKTRRRDMRDFDARVIHDYKTMRIMYR
ncbi:uncharacterized protein LOC120629495 [Pararge aegeria]|uniref:uncharacterized protein LOC120629495 n=1 Tax=Pararge aegeria TaxID=116150 RepID=UPI0019D0C38B|nr:uncharacterized protein LOC120629495 [Pararge aegeria]